MMAERTIPAPTERINFFFQFNDSHLNTSTNQLLDIESMSVQQLTVSSIILS